MTDGNQRHVRQGLIGFVCGRRGKWLIVGLWLVALVVAAPLASKLTDAQDNDAASWLPGSAESTQVLDTSNKFRPEQIPAVVVYAREGGLTAQDKQRIVQDVQQIKGLTAHGVRGAETRGPVYDKPSAPKAAQIYVPITMEKTGWEELAPAVDSLRDRVGKGGGGLAVHITGPGGTSADFSKAFEGIDSTLLFSAMGVVIVMLLLTYRSLALIFVPLIGVVAALFTSQALIYLLAKHAGLTVNGQSAGILTVLVFGAGTDYALLLVARYREELRRHEDRHEAMALALNRAGPAVLASGATVVLSMLVLLAAEMNSTRGLGPVAAIGVAIALLAMLTLFPALLLVFGRWIFWPAIRTSARPTRPRAASGPVWAAVSPSARAPSGSPPPSPWRPSPSACCRSTPRASATRTRSPASRTRSSGRRCPRGTSRRAAVIPWSSSPARPRATGSRARWPVRRVWCRTASPCRRARNPRTTARCCSRRR